MKNKSADGLRGIAAFNVAVAHFVAAFLPAMLHNNYPTVFAANKDPGTSFEVFTSPVFSILYNGHFAVLIFFVLSGYVLTIPYYSKPNHLGATTPNMTLKKRLWGRYLRLNIPIFAAVLISYGVYKSGLYSNIQAAEISGSTNWFNKYYPEGITLIIAAKEGFYESILFGKGTLVPPLWTLKVEFIGSLYILLFYSSKPDKAQFVPFLIVFCLLYALHKQQSIFYFAIFLGSLLNSFKMDINYKYLFFAVGIYFGGFQFNSIFYDYLPSIQVLDFEIFDKKTFYNAIGALMVTFAVVQGFSTKIFESKIAQFMGRISFSFYLIHFIVLCSLSSFVYIHLPPGNGYLALNFVLYIFTCLIASIIFEKFVDRNSIKISHRFSTKIFS